MPTMCPRDAHEMPAACDMHATCPRDANEMPTTCSMDIEAEFIIPHANVFRRPTSRIVVVILGAVITSM